MIGIPLPPRVEHALAAALRQDEKLLWVGSPDPRRYALGRVGRMRMFGWAWIGFWTFSYGLLLLGEQPSHFAATMVPFAAIWLLWPSVLRHRAKSVWYAISSSRALIVEDADSPRVFSFARGDIMRWRRVDRDAGYGDLILISEPRDDMGEAWRSYGLFGVADIAHVEALLRPLLEGAEPFSEKRFTRVTYPWLESVKRTWGIVQK